MRSNKPLLVVIISILISAALASGSWGESKTDMLRNLRSAASTPSSLAKYTSSLKKDSQTEAAQLAFDLIIYRWLWPKSCLPSDITSKTSTDIESIDAIITALTTALNDPGVNWALAYFAGKGDGSAPPTPRGDKRPGELVRLRSDVDAAQQARTSSPAKAVDSLSNACEVCNDKQFCLDITRALLLKEIADHCQNTMGNLAEADERYSQAAWVFGNYNCPIAYSVTYEDWAELEIDPGLYRKTAEYDEYAAQRWVDLSRKHPNKYEYLNLAGQDYIRAGHALRALPKSDEPMDMMQRGLDCLRQWTYAANKPDKTYDTLLRSLIEVSAVLRERSETSKAKNLLEEALGLCDKQVSPLLQARLYGELERLYTAVRQDKDAEKWRQNRDKTLRNTVATADSALKSLTASGFSSRSEQIAWCKTVELGAGAHHWLGDYSAAADDWQQVADYYKKLGMVDEQIAALRSRAAEFDQQTQNTFDAALAKESLDAKSEAVSAAVQAGKNAEAAAIVWDMIDTYKKLGDLNNTLEVYTDYALITLRAGDIRGYARVLNERGLRLLENGKYEDAAKDLAEARMNYIDNMRDPWAAGEVSARLAEAYAATNQPESAQSILESSLDDIERRYRPSDLDSVTDDDRNRLLQDLYGKLATVYVHTNQTEKAMSLLTKRGRLYSWRPALVKAMVAGTDKAMAAFAETLPLVSIVPLEGNPSGDNAVWASDKPGFWQACCRLRQNNSAEYNALPLDPLELHKVSSRLPKDTSVVMYMVTNTSLYTFVCDYEKATITATGLQQGELDKAVRGLRKSIGECEGNVSQGIPVQEIVTWQEPVFQKIREPLQKLYDYLVKDIKSSVEGRTRLVFVLPDELSGLPMHALISSGQETVPRFLVQDYEIGYLGPRMLDYLVSKDDILDSGTAKLIIFSDPDGNLPGAQDEVERILRDYPNNSRAYRRDSATETSFLRECQTAGIIHIAAHHKIDADPARFELLLARDENADGIVGIDELAAIQAPQLGLVVLSACDSISSSDPISTGPSGAAEVFSQIGAKSVMGGLWKVSDEAAATLMDVFYSNIAKGHVSRAESLRRAQLDMIKNKRFAHPFYWACFALYGNPR